MNLKSVLIAFCMFLYSFNASAELEINVVGARKDPMPIAFPEMISNKFNETRYASKIRNVVIADLERSGLFTAVDEDSYIQEFKSMTEMPRFVDWKAIKSQALVQSSVKQLENGNLKVEFRLWDVFSSIQLQGNAFTTEKSNWRRIAHVISDVIYERLTGEKGYFDTRIVYVAESGPKSNRTKRLAIMDQDGENHKFLTSGKTLVLTPRFSSNLQKITYLSYYEGVPRVFLLDIETGRQEKLGDFPGMTFAPRFSFDSKKVVMSLARDGNTEIYEMDLKSRSKKRLTVHPAIDTSPCYSPDGKKIVFNSDRGGNQQIYVMDSNGKNVKRISFGKGRYATPVWSPRGDYIAFTKMYQGQFYIGVMYPDGTGERLLTQGFLVEAPTWSPNGRVLTYFRQDKPRGRKSAEVKLYSIDLTGYNERKIITPVDASDPAWSPLLP
jgi:TolB protein